MKPIGIYIHVPFCAKKCLYCDFYSCSYNKDKSIAYTKAVIKHIECSESADADTVYFGGGTPSLIPAELIEEILTASKRKFNLINPEITLEINPCTVNKDKLLKYRQIGINRLSVGVQSAVDNELIFLGRNHSFEKAKEIIIAANKIGFDNISADLMTGIPGQTIESMFYSIDRLSELPLNHISNYILKIEENTPFNNEKIISRMPDDDFVSDMYLKMVKRLSEKGFTQYEISNFSKKGFESRHNLKYWHCEEYVSFGPMAHSFYNGKRYFNADTLDEYINRPSAMSVTDYTPGEDDEKIMLALRLTEGINPDDYQGKKNYILKKIKLLEKTDLINYNGKILSLTPKGFLVSNSIINEFI